MLKKGVYRIAGNTSPKVGVETLYAIAEWYPDTPILERNPAAVTWELFRKRDNGKFTSTGIKKVGVNSFTFGEKSWRYTYRLEAYLHTPEGKEPMSLIINPQQNKVPGISKVELHYADDAKGNTFSFLEKVVAKAHCVNLANEELLFTLWEDDAKGKGHDPKNLLVASKTAKVKMSNGIATAEFTLTEGLMKKAMRGEHDGQLEFYVTVEYFKNKKHESENVTITHPLYGKSQEPKHTTAQKNSVSHQPKAKGSPAEQKPKSKKEEKGFIDKMKELFDFSESEKATATKDKEPTQNRSVTNSPVKIKKNDNEKDNKNCVCKEYDLIWGNKVSCEFRKKVITICKDLWPNNYMKMANNLMACMAWETGESFSPSVKNPKSSATGLIQFMNDTATDLGTTTAELAKMDAVRQLDYVKKYFSPIKDRNYEFVDLYLKILFPASMGKPDDHVVFSKDGNGLNKDDKNYKARKNAYSVNSGFDTNPKYGNDDKMVTKGEIKKGIQIYIDKGKKNKANVFSCTKQKIVTNIETEKGFWNVIITEHYTGQKCNHIERTAIRNNCRRGKIEVYDNTQKIVLTINDCLLEGIKGEDRGKTGADVPYGTYQINKNTPFYSSTNKNKKSYGPNPRLVFEPINGSGDEADISKRSAIRIHGGRQDGYSLKTLKRTEGCIRIYDEDAKRFYEWWVDFNKNNPNVKPGKVIIKK
ncbi:L,D-transpeptidase catalytic domain [Chryseobacterium soldanellicola]|uniref:L,D-transpeptidase catalytic domain n=1 Tax=Chryseobacterium soldanellicola TaxID=311333 RepID=A0A1H0YQ09_9FLAO|nr:L,D-transpeptidase [Chryseobacterium soldanellicola]SDQ16916.1 L,D-transpeptidase catalytic domain [Chryseobacterium soldanellicola]